MQVVLIDPEVWRAPDASLLAFDHRVHGAEDRARARCEMVQVRVLGSETASERVTREVALRYQRLWPRFNAASSAPWFQRVLRAHRALHDLDKPLVRADYEHAIDVWQWLLRLDSAASAPLQVAALFHDIERLVSESDVRVEQHAADYLAFKTAHAARGAELLRETLAELCAPELLTRAAELVARHEQPEHDRELQRLNDADALSFFSLNSAGFLAYYGEAHTEKKVRYTLARISSTAAREALATLRLEPFVSAALERARQPEA